MLTKSAPSIETSRLRLRAHAADDLSRSCTLWGNPAVTLFIGGKPSTPQQCWARILTYVGHWNLLGFGYWLVEDRVTGEFLGEVGFANFNRDLTPAFGTTPEVGWAFLPSAQGKGYAHEAVLAGLTWMEQNHPTEKVVCMIAPDNQPSLKLARKLGFEEFTRASYHGEATILFERRTP